MENNNFNQEVIEQAPDNSSPLHKVTPLSKYLAMLLFIALPFLGGWIGYTYAPEKIVVVEEIAATQSQISNTQREKMQAQSDSWTETTIKLARQHNTIITEIASQINIDLSYLLVEPENRTRESIISGAHLVNPTVLTETVAEVTGKSVYNVTIFGEENQGKNDCSYVGSHCFPLVYDHDTEQVLFTEGDVIKFGDNRSPRFERLTDDYIVFKDGFGSATECYAGGWESEIVYLFSTGQIVQKMTTRGFDTCANESTTGGSVLLEENTSYTIIYNNTIANRFALPNTEAIEVKTLLNEIYGAEIFSTLTQSE